MRLTFSRLRVASLLLATASAPGFGQASTPARQAAVHRVAGSVADEGGKAVAHADIRLTATDGSRQTIQTDLAGHFVFAEVPAGMTQIEIRRMGFRPWSRNMSVPDASGRDSAHIILAVMVAELAGIEVRGAANERDGALAGFYSRQQSNLFGHYLDRAALEATHAQRPSEALRSVPGITLLPSSRVGNTVRFRNCRPTIWVDGIRIADSELDEVTTLDDVAAVEIYKSMAGLPPQFVDRTNPCGGILIWSRDH